jgi:uncharacterized Zn-binding protein involved in type VI secretion
MAARPAARLTETSVHGGKIVSGSSNVIVCNKPVARQGDGHVCPIPGHTPGRVVGCSRTVIINKRGAARMGDFIGCASPPSPPAPGPNPAAHEYKATPADDASKGMQPEGAPDVVHKKAAEHKVQNDDSHQKALYADAKFSDFDKDGKRDTMQAGIGMVNLAGRTQQKDGHFGVSGQAQVLTAGVETRGHVGKGVGGFAGAKAVGTEAGGSVFVGPKGDNGKNPYAEVGAKGTLGVAEANADGFIGDDGRRVGIGGGAKAGASVLEGEVRGRTSIPIPFTDWTIDTRGAASGGLVSSPGGEVRGALFYDKQEKRAHFSGGLAGQFLGKLGITWDFSIGKRYEQDAPPPQKAAPPPKQPPPKPLGGGAAATPSPGPNAVALGCMSVFIGG